MSHPDHQKLVVYAMHGISHYWHRESFARVSVSPIRMYIRVNRHLEIIIVRSRHEGLQIFFGNKRIVSFLVVCFRLQVCFKRSLMRLSITSFN